MLPIDASTSLLTVLDQGIILGRHYVSWSIVSWQQINGWHASGASWTNPPGSTRGKFGRGFEGDRWRISGMISMANLAVWISSSVLETAPVWEDQFPVKGATWEDLSDCQSFSDCQLFAKRNRTAVATAIPPFPCKRRRCSTLNQLNTSNTINYEVLYGCIHQLYEMDCQ